MGKTEEAWRLVADDGRLARRWGTGRALGIVLRTRASLEGGARSTEWLSQAVAALEDSPARLELAHALVELGASLRRAGRRSEARERLRRGLELAHVCSAWALEERAVEELVVAGVRPQRFQLSGVESLTPSERRVAGLAAEGLSNREIAGALYITNKTVEVHLTHAYRKLDIRSRTQLGRAPTPPG